jgi:hypothetical protein
MVWERLSSRSLPHRRRGSGRKPLLQKPSFCRSGYSRDLCIILNRSCDEREEIASVPLRSFRDMSQPESPGIGDGALRPTWEQFESRSRSQQGRQRRPEHPSALQVVQKGFAHRGPWGSPGPLGVGCVPNPFGPTTRWVRWEFPTAMGAGRPAPEGRRGSPRSRCRRDGSSAWRSRA